MPHRFLAVLTAIFLFFPLISAQAELSLEDCLRRVNQGSVQIAQSEVNVARAKAAVHEVQSQKLPQLLGQANLYKSYDLVNQATDANKAVIRVEQSAFPFFGPVWPTATQRSRELETAEIAKVESEQDVRVLVKQLYFSILRDRDSIERMKEIEKDLASLLDRSLPHYNFGAAHSFDSVKIRSTKYDLVRARALLEAQLIFEISELSQIISVSNSEAANLRPIKNLPSLPPVERIRSLSLATNPTVLLNEKQIQASSASVRAAEFARIPSLSAFYEVGSLGQTLNTMYKGWDAGVQFRLVIFDWGLISSQVSQAEAQVQLSEKKRQADLERNESAISQAHALAEAHLLDRTNLNGILAETRRTALDSRERYRHAGIGIIELTDAINLWLQTTLNERAAYYGYLTDFANLERLAGEGLKVNYE
jgi:outer membrane protein TolC